MIREFLFRSFLKEDEEILLVIHRHPVTVFSKLLKVFIFGILIPVVIWWFFRDTVLFVGIWGWCGFMIFLYAILDWYYDVWLVTNINIVHVIWDGFFSKSGERTEYHHIESISYEVKGFWATLLNHGTIVVEKETGNLLTFEKAVTPKRKVEKMLVFQEHFMTEKNIRDHKTLKALMTDLVSHHFKEYIAPQQKKIQK